MRNNLNVYAMNQIARKPVSQSPGNGFNHSDGIGNNIPVQINMMRNQKNPNATNTKMQLFPMQSITNSVNNKVSFQRGPKQNPNSDENNIKRDTDSCHQLQSAVPSNLRDSIPSTSETYIPKHRSNKNDKTSNDSKERKYKKGREDKKGKLIFLLDLLR